MSKKPKHDRPGRPKLGADVRARIVAMSIPPAMVDDLETVAAATKRSRSAVVVDLLAKPLKAAVKRLKG